VNVAGAFNDTLPPLGNSGAVGPNHFVQFATGQFTVFNKSGTVAEQITDTAFWTQVAGLTLSDSLDEPRIVYDPISQRWFAAAVTTKTTGNPVLLARSDTSDPTGTWKGVTYTSTSQYGTFPTLAVDATGVYVGTGNFDHGPPGATPTGSTMTSIPKADLLLAT